jgi:hypothetical protein
VRYEVYLNGRPRLATARTSTATARDDGLREYQVLAVNAAGDESFLSEPVRVLPRYAELTVKPAAAKLEREHAGYTGGGYVRLSRDQNLTVAVPVHVALDGVYALDARYANGNGPVNTEDKVAVRTVLVDGDTVGVLVMPQRGANRWSEWGWSSSVRAPMRAGDHTLTITYTLLDANMNQRENTALLDQLRLTRFGNSRARPASGNSSRGP